MFEVLIKEKGLKVTPNRVAILNIFASKETFFDAERVWNNLVKLKGPCSLPSVYRNLETFVEVGILDRIYHRGSKNRYILSANPETGHNHYMICTECQGVEVLRNCGFENISCTGDFMVTSHITQLEGVCGSCKK